MKKIILEFFRRGMVACGFGPIILAILYLIFQRQVGIETLTVNEVCLGIFSISALAFIAGAMNAIYQIERLPLMVAVLIHGGVLYISYLVTYLLNGWLESDATPIFVFTVLFIFGYLAVWAVIYFTIRRNTEKVNEVLKKKQQNIKLPS